MLVPRTCLSAARRSARPLGGSLLKSSQQRKVHMEAVVYPPYLPSPSNSSGPSQQLAYPHDMKSMSKGTTVYDALTRLGEEFEEVPLDGGSPYVQPASVYYTFDSRKKRWDVVGAMSSVGVVIYHTQLQSFLLVRQFRPAVYSYQLREASKTGGPTPDRFEGFVYELCAGLMDKSKPLKEVAREEILEEVGYDVPVDKLIDLGCGISSAGTAGAPHYMYFATVDESMKALGQGGGLADHGECIEVLALPLEKANAFVMDNSLPKSPGAMFGLTWGYHWIKANLLPGGGNGTNSKPNPNLTEELVLKPVLPS